MHQPTEIPCGSSHEKKYCEDFSTTEENGLRKHRIDTPTYDMPPTMQRFTA